MNKAEDSLGYEPEVRSTQAVEEEISSLSSRVLDMLDVKGKVTEAKPLTNPCEFAGSDSASYYVVRHPWSLYGIDNKLLEKGMDNLGSKLEGQGWKIERTGKDESKNQNLEILAIHMKTRSQLEVTWLKGLDGHEPLIEVTLYSRCFRESERPTPTASPD